MGQLSRRINGLIKAELNHSNHNSATGNYGEPEKLLELAIENMQEALVQMRQAVAQAIATQKRTQQQYDKALTDVKTWQQRAQLALTKGDENLAQEALVGEKNHYETAVRLKVSLNQQTTQVDTLKRNLSQMESKISEVKTAVGELGTSSAMGAFERIEEKVQLMKPRAQSAQELTGNDLERQLAQLEAGNDVDDELAAMKAILNGALPNQAALPASNSTPSQGNDVDDELAAMKAILNGASPNQAALPASNSTPSQSKSEVDEELEALRKQMNQM